MAGKRETRAWQRMMSGRRLDILAPSPLDIEIEDIALGLSRVARWNGQTQGEHAYSVAQHCILVAELVAASTPAAPASCLLAALLHDAPEYVTSDLITPFKRAVGVNYEAIEDKVAQAVHAAFGLPGVLPAEWRRAIDAADHMAAFLEAVNLAGFSEAEARSVFGVSGEVPGIDLEAWAPGMAKKAFLAVYTDLAAGGSRCLARWGMRQQGGTVVYLRRSAGAPVAQSPLAGSEAHEGRDRSRQADTQSG